MSSKSGAILSFVLFLSCVAVFAKGYQYGTHVTLNGVLVSSTADAAETWDEKPHQFPALKLENAISVLSPPGNTECLSAPGVMLLQLVLSNSGMKQFKRWKGKAVKVKGFLFCWQTGHHYTSALLDVATVTLSATEGMKGEAQVGDQEHSQQQTSKKVIEIPANKTWLVHKGTPDSSDLPMAYLPVGNNQAITVQFYKNTRSLTFGLPISPKGAKQLVLYVDGKMVGKGRLEFNEHDEKYAAELPNRVKIDLYSGSSAEAHFGNTILKFGLKGSGKAFDGQWKAMEVYWGD